ncbi:hypothetical protein QE152_g20719 [Popillia japonica]|uniref:Uncharacterized protein n=1 Tax=Popillia japonica TaxID=7064 RepID=A0AAW1KM80_POPJA
MVFPHSCGTPPEPPKLLHQPTYRCLLKLILRQHSLPSSLLAFLHCHDGRYHAMDGVPVFFRAYHGGGTLPSDGLGDFFERFNGCWESGISNCNSILGSKLNSVDEGETGERTCGGAGEVECGDWGWI